ncbi:hypothetical protein HID58_067588 [Brassica napus]|uniref:Uncharacterized protein n=1 Tax=Brassica napus TaxID=3708 RepID=A0ABQ7ZJ20_BRANA|nr:hypothetical protein HID58_067588 [Brassica napus]
MGLQGQSTSTSS